MTCPNNVCGTGIVPGPKPGDPDNNLAIYATQSYGGIDVSWTYPSTNPHAVAHVQLYRSTSHLVVTAIQIAVVAGNTYYDKINEVGTYFYWIKVVSVNGTVGEFVGPASATTRLRSQDTVEDLTGQIDRGVLATTLRQDIEDITLNKEELLDAIKDLVAGNDALSGAMSDLQNGLTQAVSFVNTEITERQEGQNALAQQITVVAAANANNAALIVNERTARVSAIDAVTRSVDSLRVATGENAAAILSESNARTTQYSALATKTDTVQSTLSNQIASVRTEAETVITQMDGRIQAIGARWTAQVSVNGLIGGFGVYNDGRFVEAGFDVDRFWVGRTNSNKRKPFIIENDQTYIDSAVIRNGSIDNAKIGVAAIKTANIGVAEIDTLRIAGNAVSIALWGMGTNGAQIGFTVPPGEVWESISTAAYTGSSEFGNGNNWTPIGGDYHITGASGLYVPRSYSHNNVTNNETQDSYPVYVQIPVTRSVVLSHGPGYHAIGAWYTLRAGNFAGDSVVTLNTLVKKR